MQDTAKSDKVLVDETLKNRHAFAALVERYEARLMRYIRRLGADNELAKDILQESFIKAYINLNDFDSSLSFSAWIYRIVHNESISQFRKLKVRPAPVEREEDLELFAKIPDGLDLPKEADKRLINAAVQQALQSLEEKYRTVVVLRFFENKSYDEISDILKIPAGTVATYLSRAKLKLAWRLQKDKAVEL